MNKIVAALTLAIFLSLSIDAQVFLNRSAPLTSSEVFGMTKNVGGILSSKFGGMYIETKNSNAGKPFYGYAMDGAVKAYQYFDGVDNGVHLYNGALTLSMWKDSMQYNLGNDVRLFYDGAKLEFGKNGNTFIGKGVTPFDLSSNIGNTVTGWLSARKMTGGVSNTIFGFRSSEELLDGDFNTIVGSESANKLSTGSRNTLIGYRAGWNASSNASGNVFIGNRAGEDDRGSNKLIISNSETTIPLIEGRFDNQELTINGDTRVEGETVLDGETTVNGNLGVTGQSFQQSANLSGSSPFLDFKPGGSSKFYIQYQPSGDQLIIHRTGLGDVLRIKSDGSIYFPILGGGGAYSDLEISSTGKLIKSAYPTFHEYYFIEELNTPFESNANLIPVKDLKEGEVLTELVIRAQWPGFFSNPTEVGFVKMNKVTKVQEVIASISGLPTASYNQEFSTSFNHVVNTDANIYFLLLHEDSNYTYIVLKQ
jgi:hypothetical protein